MTSKVKIATLALVILLASLPGCDKVAIIGDAGESSLAAPIPTVLILTPAPVQSDIAVTAVDLEPLLSSTERVITQSVSMSAVIENKGNQSESNILVEAVLCGETEEDLLLRNITQIDALVPGESKVIRFSPMSRVPPKSNYILIVEAQPVPGEELIYNNTKMYHLKVSLPNP